ncbi:hypothetical protein ABK040_012041 [Willaertia magna]
MLSSEIGEHVNDYLKKNSPSLQQLPLEMLLHIISFWFGDAPTINEKMESGLCEKLSLQLLEKLKKNTETLYFLFPDLSGVKAFFNFTMTNKFFYQLLTNCKLSSLAEETKEEHELIDEFKSYLVYYINYFQKLIYWKRTKEIDEIKLGTGDIPYTDVLQYCKLQSVIQTSERAKLSNVKESTTNYYGYHDNGDDEQGTGYDRERENTNSFMQADTQENLNLKLIKRLNKLNLTENDIFNLTQIEHIGLIDVLKYQLFNNEGKPFFVSSGSGRGGRRVLEVNNTNNNEEKGKIGVIIREEQHFDIFKDNNELLNRYCYFRLIDVKKVPERTFHSIQFLTLEFSKVTESDLQKFLKKVYFPNVLYLEIYLDQHDRYYVDTSEQYISLQYTILGRVLKKKIFPKLIHLKLDGFSIVSNSKNNILIESDIYYQLLSITFLSRQYALQFEISSLHPKMKRNQSYEDDDDYVDVIEKKRVKKRVRNQYQRPLLKYVVGEVILFSRDEDEAIDTSTLKRIYNNPHFVFSISRSSITNFYDVCHE